MCVPVTLFLLFLSNFSATAQCLPAAPPDVTCMAGTTVSNGNNINNGDVDVHCASSGTVSNVNLNGGTLQVCGDLTLTNFNYNGGTIRISQYGHLTINGNLTMNNNCTIVNYGRLNVNGNMNFQNNNNTVYNARLDASIVVTGGISFPSNSNQNSYLVNKGFITSNTFSIADGATVICLESGSYIGVSVLTMNITGINNPVTFGSVSGSAMIRYSGSASFNGSGRSLTLSSAVTVCRGGGASASTGSGNIGGATATSGCTASLQPTQTGSVTTCYTLPVKWLSFNGSFDENDVVLRWSTATEENNDYFSVEMSTDGIDYKTIGRVDGAGTSVEEHHYEFRWNTKTEGDYYFRIRQVDFNGQYDFSRVIAVTVSAPQNRIVMAPNPFASSLRIYTPVGNYRVFLYDEAGRMVMTYTLSQGDNQLETAALANGLYTAMIVSGSGELLRHELLSKVTE